MKNIIFIAPPAAGKGTQSDLLVDKYGYVHISTGDLLRSEAASGSELGETIKSLLGGGKLISSDIVNALLTKALSETDKPIILDGYPRNMEQVPYLEEILTKINKSIDLVINLDVPYDILMKRAVGRLSCPNCAHTFNKFFNKPKVDNTCDLCGTELISRSDDNEDTFKVRFDSYLENTKPLLDYYNDKGLLINIGYAETADEIFKEIEKVIK